jgi:hypothetical protein
MTHPHDDELEDADQRRWKRGWIVLAGIALALTCGIVLPPLVSANHFRARLAGDLSAALGRPVQMDNVRLRLLPRPGFDFGNFEVDAEPRFGAEPVVRAAKVTVGIRLLPLWRGRIEVATVSLQDASLNVERNAGGEWNFASLLERTAQLPRRLPAAQPNAGARAQFPYFEVTNGRINFKRGEEKLPFSFTDAEFSLWLDNPGEWRLRFRAAPVRTDMDAAYTGDFRLEGSVHDVADSLANAHIALQGSWRHAPLGQVSRVLTSEDRGWRGDASVDFTLAGTPSAATVQAHIGMDGLRREDFVPVANVPMQADCTASLGLLTQVVDHATCTVPTGAGRIAVSATSVLLERNMRQSSSTLGVALDHVPADWLLASLRLVRQGLAPDLSAGGEVSGNFSYSAAALPHLSGHASWQGGVLVVSGSDVQPLRLPEVVLDASASPRKTARPGRSHSARGKFVAADETRASLQLQPLALNLGGDLPLKISGAMGRHAYSLSVNGSAPLQQVVPLLRALGFARWAVLHRITGTALVDLRIQDSWMRNLATPPSVVEGTATLHTVVADTAWLPGTLRLTQGKVSLSQKIIAWQGLQWTWAGAKFDGAATLTSLCGNAADCGWRITAHTPALDLQQILNVFQPSATDQLAAFFGGAAAAGWPLFQIDVSADTLTAGRLAVNHFAAGMTAANANLQITRCSGVMLGSAMECSGSVALDHGAGQLSIALSRASMAAGGAFFKETWGTGTAETSVELKLQRGSSPSGTFTAMLRDASFSGATPSSPLAHVQSWQMSGQILSDHLQLDRSLLTSAGRDYPITGSIGFDRHLNLTMTGNATAPQHIGGTVPSPRMQ